MTTFDVRDLDQEFLRNRSEKEAKRIFNKESTRKGRSYIEILKTVMYGQASEVFMLSQGYKNNPQPYQDILEKSDEEPSEVKTTEKEAYIPDVLRRCKNIIDNDKWRNHPKIVHIWINNKKDFIYKYYGKYVYNGKEFIVH